MISIGVDSGFGKSKGGCGITWLDASVPARPVFLGTRTIHVGHSVPLAKVRRNKRGAEQTDETIVDDADLEALRSVAGLLFQEIASSVPGRIVILTVERVQRVHPHERFSANFATCLVHAAWIGAEIAALGCAMFGSTRVSTVTEQEWRDAVIGSGGARVGPAGASEDQQLAIVVPAAVTGWPARSNAHARDAAGVALFGARRAHLRQAAKVREEFNALPRHPHAKPLAGHGALCPGMACKMPAHACARALRPIAPA